MEVCRFLIVAAENDSRGDTPQRVQLFPHHAGPQYLLQSVTERFAIGPDENEGRIGRCRRVPEEHHIEPSRSQPAGTAASQSPAVGSVEYFHDVAGALRRDGVGVAFNRIGSGPDGECDQQQDGQNENG